ncbi:entericidin A/B family lipoprotein [Zobellella taiwanensis]|jgi:predicted small secreted protein|uniref:Entericidin n=1 Tax=Zobellella taiwanensis TaxID=347535 RepID=A0A2P7QGX1_9GAMM|nr:entericidin A/B family lipoprotein [Zobellella taiwanensis]PSJ37212.1 entericidin [Zobellella taiwanensis]
MKRTLLAVLMLAGFGLSGCNTFAGAGQDIKRGGEVVEEAARDVQSNM